MERVVADAERVIAAHRGDGDCLTFEARKARSACRDFTLTSVERRANAPRQRFAMSAGFLVVNSDLTQPRGWLNASGRTGDNEHIDWISQETARGYDTYSP